MIKHVNNMVDILVDGKFIKINKNPIIDFLKFKTEHYPFYNLMYNKGLLKPFKQMLVLEPTSFLKYKKINKLGVLYKSNTGGYIYTHYGKQLENIDNYYFYKHVLKSQLSFKMKRVDYAYDLYGIDLIPLILNSQIHSKRQLKIKFLSYNSNKEQIYSEDKSFHNNITTIYIGSLKSNISICIYKKHLKLNVTGPITRIEIRFKNNSAEKVKLKEQDNVSSSNHIIKNYLDYYVSFKVPNSSKSNKVSRLKTSPWWADFLNCI